VRSWNQISTLIGKWVPGFVMVLLVTITDVETFLLTMRPHVSVYTCLFL